MASLPSSFYLSGVACYSLPSTICHGFWPGYARLPTTMSREGTTMVFFLGPGVSSTISTMSPDEPLCFLIYRHDTPFSIVVAFCKE
jgi:hypothetical protein